MDGTRVEEFEPPVIIRVARNLEDMQRIAVVRALVYMAEQDCPYDEEFDGNDLAGATHLLGEAGGEDRDPDRQSSALQGPDTQGPDRQGPDQQRPDRHTGSGKS